MHGLPFAIAGVACALGSVSELIATVRKNTTTVPITAVTIAVLVAGRMSSSNLSARAYNDSIATTRCFLIVFVSLRTTPVYGIAQVMQDKDREGRHALFLFGTESLIERLPGFGEPFQVG